MDSAVRDDQVKTAAQTRWPRSPRLSVQAARRARFSARPTARPKSFSKSLTHSSQASGRIRDGSSNAANDCGIAAASLATGLIAAFCS